MSLAETLSGHARRSGPSTGLILALAVLFTAALWAVVPGLFTSLSPVEGIAAHKLTAPGSAHWLGTDELGRDVLTRLIHGARQTLTAATLAVGVGLTFGSLIGLLARASGGWIEAAVMRFVDVLLSIPSLLLALSLIVIMGFCNLQVAIAVGATSVAGFARLIWSEVITVRRTDYVEAAFGSGGSFAAVLWRHVLPNALRAVLAYAALQFGWAILQISTLGFLGYGAPPPTPEWGLMIAEGRNYMTTSSWLTVFPGLSVILGVLAANTVSRALRRDER